MFSGNGRYGAVSLHACPRLTSVDLKACGRVGKSGNPLFAKAWRRVDESGCQSVTDASLFGMCDPVCKEVSHRTHALYFPVDWYTTSRSVALPPVKTTSSQYAQGPQPKE